MTVTLDGLLVDTGTTPDTIYAIDPATFSVTSGVINFSLPQSATQNTTYHFVFTIPNTSTVYYYQDGTIYTGPTHVWVTDGQTYTGTVHNSDSKVLSVVTQDKPTTVLDFHAIVPNVASIDFAQLVPTGIGDSLLDTSISALANLLTTNSTYIQALKGGPNPKGTYAGATYYQYGDCVSYAGSSWLYINSSPAAGQVPTTSNTTYWQQLASKGDAGGTGGQDTPYDATGWDGQTWAPTANAIRDVIVTLATQAQLASYAPLNNAALTGNPTRVSAPSFGDRSSQLATTNWVGTEFATLASPTFTGTVAVPLVSTSDASNKAASTLWVNNFITALRVLETPFICYRKTTAQTLTNNTYNAVTSWDVQVADTNTAFNASTGTFTVPSGQGGWYEFMLTLTSNRTSGAAAYDFNLYIYDGTTYWLMTADLQANSTTVGRSGTRILFLTAGSTIRPIAFLGNTTSTVAIASSGAGFSFNEFTARRQLL